MEYGRRRWASPAMALVLLATSTLALWSATSILSSPPAGATPAPGYGTGSGYCSQYAGGVASPYSFDNVTACRGTTSGATTFDNPGPYYAWQCVELSARFLWAVYGIWAGPGTGISGGSQLVSVVHSQHPTIAVGAPGPGSVPAAGDVISLGPGGGSDASVGHTAVVVSANSATGSFVVMSENDPEGSAGEQTLQVDLGGAHNGAVQFNGLWTTASWLTLTSSSPLTVPAASYPTPVQGQPYSTSLSASGGTTPYSWQVVGGALPAGLALSSNGVISGTPSGDATGTGQITVTDSSSPPQSATFSFTFPVEGVLNVPAETWPTAVQGQPFSVALAANGGTTPYTWQLANGGFPAGLSLASDGVISGTPETAGNFSGQITVTDSSSPSITVTISFTLPVQSNLTVTAVSYPDPVQGQPYNLSLTASGGTAPYIWQLASGALPPGLDLSTDGTVDGIAYPAGTYTGQISVTDSGSPSTTVTFPFTFVVDPPLPTQSITFAAPASGTVGHATTLTATGGGSGNPVVFSLDSESAAGVCQLSGTNGAVVSYTGVGKCVIDANQAGNASFHAANPVQQTIPVSSSGTPVISSSAYLPRATIGLTYHDQLQASGGNAPYKWKLAKGSAKLPKGLKLNSTGLVSGTTEVLGRVTFTAEVSGVKLPKQPNSATQSETIVVSKSPDINGDGLVNCADLAIMSSQWGQSGPNLSADLDGNGVVGASDLSILSQNWTSGQPTTC